MATTTLERQSQPAATAAIEKEAWSEIERVVEECELAQLQSQGKYSNAFALAKGIRQLRDMITPEMMKDVMPLMNTALGFKTDKDPNRPVWNNETKRKEAPQPYPMEIVKECLIEAVLRGANPVGNEFNIITASAYTTRQFYQRVVGQIEGITQVQWMPGAVQLKDDGEALVSCMLKWKRNGREECIDRTGTTPQTARLQVRLNKGMGIDGAIGKAARKVYKQAYEQITGSEGAPDGEVDDIVPGSVVPSPAAKTTDFDERLKSAQPATAAPASTATKPPLDNAAALEVLKSKSQSARDAATETKPPENLPAANEAVEDGTEADAIWNDPAKAEKRCREQARDISQIARADFNAAISRHAVSLGHGPVPAKLKPEQWQNVYAAITAKRFNFSTGLVE